MEQRVAGNESNLEASSAWCPYPSLTSNRNQIQIRMSCVNHSCTCVFNGLHKNGSLGLHRLVLPNKINKILWGVDELGIRSADLRINECRLFMRYHSSIDSDSSIFHLILGVDQPNQMLSRKQEVERRTTSHSIQSLGPPTAPARTNVQFRSS